MEVEPGEVGEQQPQRDDRDGQHRDHADAERHVGRSDLADDERPQHPGDRVAGDDRQHHQQSRP